MKIEVELELLEDVQELILYYAPHGFQNCRKQLYKLIKDGKVAKQKEQDRIECEIERQVNKSMDKYLKEKEAIKNNPSSTSVGGLWPNCPK